MLTQEEVKRLFDYKDGNLIRKVRVGNNGEIGAYAGCDNGSGYFCTKIDGKTYKNYRLIWLWHYGYFPENFIDHIDRNKSNDRIENLREVSRSCNGRNIDLRKDNTSGVKGVHWHKRDKVWSGQIVVNMKKCYLGGYTDFTEVVAHRLAAEQSLNWVGCDSSSPAYVYMQNYIKANKE